MICRNISMSVGESIVVDDTTLTYSRTKDGDEIVVRIECPDHVALSAVNKKGRERVLSSGTAIDIVSR